MRDKLTADEEEIKRLKRELDQMKMKAASASTADAAASAVEVKGVKVLARRVDGVEKAQMRELVDQLRGKDWVGALWCWGRRAKGRLA